MHEIRRRRFPTARRGANRPRFGVHARVIERFGVRGDAVYIFLAVILTTALAGLTALALRRPLIFPSLGPSVFLVFERPMEPESSPRNMLLGHGLALVVSYAAVSALGLGGSTAAGHLTVARLAAACLSVGLTDGMLVLFRAPHPPAGATALIVGLGLLSTPRDLLALAAGVVLVTAAAWLINRALRIPVPVWAPPGAPS